jgi:quercetin dioxygenase-like cupin family protein
MQVTRNSLDTTKQPSERFSGDVYADVVTTTSAESHVKASHVHFSPGSRTAWHSHPKGQTIYVTEGIGLCQRRGAPIEVIRPGDRVFFEPDEDHWHGAAPNRFMTHLAIVNVTAEGKSATWGAHVSAEEYSGARATDAQSST